MHLIGPELFLDYTRLLRTLFVTIVPIVAAVVGLVQVVGGGPVGSMIGTTVGAAITTTVHIFFWTTLAFAAIERTQAVRGPLTGPWTPAMLPEPPPSRRARFGELMAETVALVLFGSLLLLAPRLSPKSDADGNPINILSPWLWETGFVYVFIGLVVASLGLSYANHYARWSAPLSIAATIVDLAAPLALIWLAANDRMLNPAFIEAVGWTPEVDPMDPHWTDCGLRAHDPPHDRRRRSPGAPPLSRQADCPDREGAVMKAIVYHEYGPPEVLRYADVAQPTIADDEVLVRVRAASINFGDRAAMHGIPNIMRLAFGLRRPKATILGSRHRREWCRRSGRR